MLKKAYRIFYKIVTVSFSDRIYNMKYRPKYLATIVYISTIILINRAFSRLPVYIFWGSAISPMDPVAGVIYLFRDFAQRELGHYIFVAMLIGAGLSFFLASHAVAIASVSGFVAGECIDWSVFTFTKKPLRDRLLWSASLSSPVDSIIFLYFIHRLNLLAVFIMTISKIAGILLIWSIWLVKYKSAKSRP